MPYALAALFVLGTSILYYLPDQSDFHIIFPIYTLLFAVYIYFISGKQSKLSLRALIAIAILCRVISVFAFPNLSDDIYRFIWDGEIMLKGYNPFNLLPSELIGSASENNTTPRVLYSLLNSKDYYSIYPPISQGLFYLSALLANNSWQLFSIFLKLFIVAAECGSIFLFIKILSFLKYETKLSLIYALNPLVIIETCGNLHFEGFMVFFFLLFTWYYIRGKTMISMAWLACSIGVKLIPLIFLPFILKHLGIQKFIRCAFILFGILVLLFIPVFIGVDVSNFLESLDLYFRSFEFNASIYYLLRFIGYTISGYNLIAWIGPFLALTTFVLIIRKSIRTKIEHAHELFYPFLWSFTIFLLLSTTIHPWYLILPVALSVFYANRYILFWSFLIFMTYINYSYEFYHENLWIVAIEYIIVFVLFMQSLKARQLG